MLQTMRQLAQSWVAKGLMLLLILSFGIWGINDIFHGNSLQRSVAKVGRLSITVETLNRSFERTLAQARQMFGPELTSEQAKQMGIYDQTLNKLIEQSQVEQDVERLGINVSDREFLDRLAAMPQFRDKDGKFDKNLFKRVAEQSPTFINDGRKQMAQQQLFLSLQANTTVPQVIAENLYQARGQKRILDVVTVKDEDFTDIPAPDEQTLQAYYDQNAQKFVAPEYRGITVVHLTTDDLAKDVTVTDDDLKKQYDAKAAELTKPERRDLMQIVVQDEGRAKKLAAEAKAEGDFSAVAKKAGLTPVALNQVDAKSVLPELAKNVFNLGTGQISDPVKSGLGWHVVQVKKIIPGGKPDFDSVKDQLRESAKRDKAVEDITRTVNELDDQLAAGHSLEDIADSMKLRLIKIPAIDAQGKTPDGKAPAELPDRDNVLKQAFGQGSGETSPVLDDKQGNYTVIRTDEITPGAVPPLEQIKDRVVAAWKAGEQDKRAAAAAEDIAKGIREGKTPSSFAAQSGVDVRVSRPISLLNDKDPSLPTQMLPQIFKMKKGDVIVVPAEDRQFVLRLNELVNVEPTKKGEEMDKITDELASQMPNDLDAQYVKYLQVLFPVDIDQSRLETARQQGS